MLKFLFVFIISALVAFGSMAKSLKAQVLLSHLAEKHMTHSHHEHGHGHHHHHHAHHHHHDSKKSHGKNQNHSHTSELSLTAQVIHIEKAFLKDVAVPLSNYCLQIPCSYTNLILSSFSSSIFRPPIA
jgi:predicted tellurium resistance membrane protein TerC